MDKYLRSWRQEALNKGQHDAAIYIGDKVLALTSMHQEQLLLLRLTTSRRRF
jgi:anaphase-promoting complex subunit 6